MRPSASSTTTTSYFSSIGIRTPSSVGPCPWTTTSRKLNMATRIRLSLHLELRSFRVGDHFVPSSVNLPQCHGHRWGPPLAIVAPLVMRRQCSTVVAEPTLTTRVAPQPKPYALPIGQGLAFGVPVAVEKMRLKLPRGHVVFDDLEAANVHRPDAAVRRVHDELSAWRPLVDVACHDRLSLSA